MRMVITMANVSCQADQKCGCDRCLTSTKKCNTGMWVCIGRGHARCESSEPLTSTAMLHVLRCALSFIFHPNEGIHTLTRPSERPCRRCYLRPLGSLQRQQAPATES